MGAAARSERKLRTGLFEANVKYNHPRLYILHQASITTVTKKNSVATTSTIPMPSGPPTGKGNLAKMEISIYPAMPRVPCWIVRVPKGHYFRVTEDWWSDNFRRHGWALFFAYSSSRLPGGGKGATFPEPITAPNTPDLQR